MLHGVLEGLGVRWEVWIGGEGMGLWDTLLGFGDIVLVVEEVALVLGVVAALCVVDG